MNKLSTPNLLTEIKGMKHLAPAEIKRQIEHGAQFVVYSYTFSILLMTFKRYSSVYFIKAGNSSVIPGLRYLVLSLVFGWWSLPLGPIYTIQTAYNTLSGGTDVTEQVILAIATSTPMNPEHLVSHSKRTG